MAGPHIGTGAGATHAVLTDLDSAKIESIEEDGQEIPVVDASALDDTDFRVKLVGDLKEPGQVTMIILADTSVRWTPSDATLGLLTITDRQLAGETAPGNIAGNAWLVSANKSTPLEGVVIWTLIFQWQAGYTFTPPTTS